METSDIVSIDVGGTVFKISKKTLQNLPDSLLAHVTGPHRGEPFFRKEVKALSFVNNTRFWSTKGDVSVSESGNNVFVDRSSHLVPYILDAYRTRALHLPTNVCSGLLRRELWFWGVSEDLITSCCWRHFNRGLDISDIVDNVNTYLVSPTDAYQETRCEESPTTLEKIWYFLEQPNYNRLACVWKSIYFVMLALSVIHYPLTTIAQLRERKPEFAYVDLSPNNETLLSPIEDIASMQGDLSLRVIYWIVTIFFTFDLVIRFISCPLKKSLFCNIHSTLDIFIVLIAWCSFITEAIHDKRQTYTTAYVLFIVRNMNVFNALRTLHISRNFPELKTMYLSFRASAKELLLFFVVLMTAVVIFATGMYIAENIELLENKARQTPFDSIVICMWWAVITLTTVGYGDIYPESPLGRCVATMAAFCGILIIAMPIALIAGNFADFCDNLTSLEQVGRRRKYLDQLQEHSLCSSDSDSDWRKSEINLIITQSQTKNIGSEETPRKKNFLEKALPQRVLSSHSF